jgi:transcriptional regulator with XRE-family HTH domain
MFQNWSSMVLATAAQIRAARGLIGWSQTQLAMTAGLSLMTVKRFETQNGVKVSSDAIEKMMSALEGVGVIFIAKNGDGPGVRIKKEFASEA